MDKLKDRLYLSDRTTTVGFMVFLWLILGYTLYCLKLTIVNPLVLTVVFTAGISAGVLATLTMLAVLDHLRRHKDELYNEEIRNRG